MKEIFLLDKSFRFSVRIVKLYQLLCDEKKEFVLSNKESRETKYWLRLMKETDYIDEKLFQSLFKDCDELSKLLYSTIKTSRIKK